MRLIFSKLSGSCNRFSLILLKWNSPVRKPATGIIYSVMGPALPLNFVSLPNANRKLGPQRRFENLFWAPPALGKQASITFLCADGGKT